MTGTNRLRAAGWAAVLGLLSALAGCAHQREAYYPPSGSVAAGSEPMVRWPWSKTARGGQPMEPALSASTRAQAEARRETPDDEDRFDYDYFRE